MSALLKRLASRCLDWVEDATGRRDPRIPPRILNYNQGRKLLRTKQYEREYYENSCLREVPFLMQNLGLKSDSKVLDYGCGIGRLTYALAKHLNDAGFYHGVDIVKSSIDFLRCAYQDRKQIRFQHAPIDVRHYDADLKHAKLNKNGIPSNAIRIDAPDGFFDIQVSVSVFTHMFAEDIVASMREINRVLKLDARCVNTFLIVDDHAKYMLNCGLADRPLPFERDGMYYYDEDNILVCTAYSLEKVHDIYRAAGHTIKDIRYGSWAGRDNGALYQDLVISHCSV